MAQGTSSRKRVVIVGAGFGGPAVAQPLSNQDGISLGPKHSARNDWEDIGMNYRNITVAGSGVLGFLRNQ